MHDLPHAAPGEKFASRMNALLWIWSWIIVPHDSCEWNINGWTEHQPALFTSTYMQLLHGLHDASSRTRTHSRSVIYMVGTKRVHRKIKHALWYQGETGKSNSDSIRLTVKFHSVIKDDASWNSSKYCNAGEIVVVINVRIHQGSSTLEHPPSSIASSRCLWTNTRLFSRADSCTRRTSMYPVSHSISQWSDDQSGAESRKGMKSIRVARILRWYQRDSFTLSPNYKLYPARAIHWKSRLPRSLSRLWYHESLQECRLSAFPHLPPRPTASMPGSEPVLTTRQEQTAAPPALPFVSYFSLEYVNMVVHWVGHRVDFTQCIAQLNIVSMNIFVTVCESSEAIDIKTFAACHNIPRGYE